MMSRILIILLLLIAASSSFSQKIGKEAMMLRNNNSVMAIQSSVYLNPNKFSVNYLENQQVSNAKYTHPLKKVGKILTFVGVPVMILGTVMVANSTALYYNCYNGHCEGDPLGGFGIIFLAAGTASTATGITLWAIGGSKSSK